MKIYTEINYKWLDSQLVKTSSKSFEYEGDLTLCGGGGGGGGKGGGGGGSSPLSIGGTTGELLDAGRENLHDAADAGKTNLETAADAGADARDELIETFIEEPIEEVEEEIAETVQEAVGPSTPINSFAKGNKGKAVKNNPFLAIDKNKNLARSTTKIRRPSATSTV